MATNLERLRLLHAVAAHGSIAAAAREVGYTASAVSQQLAALERDVTAALFERSNRGVSLTAAGELLSRRASVILDLVDAAVDEVGRQVPTDRPFPVRVGAFPTAISALLLPFAASAASAASSLQITIVDLEPGHALRALHARIIDAAIVDHYDNGWNPLPVAMNRTTLLVEPLRVITPTRRSMPTTLESLADASWVLGAGDGRLGRATRSACHAAGFEPQVIAETDDHRVAFDIVRATGAVTIQPDLALADAPRRVAATPIDVGCMRHIEFVTRSLPTANESSRSPLDLLAELLVATATARG